MLNPALRWVTYSKYTMVLKFLLTESKPYRRYLFIAALVQIISAIDCSLRPYVIKKLVDGVTINNHDTVVFYSVLLGVIAVIMLAAWRFWDWSMLKYEPPIKDNIAKNLIQKISHYDWGYFQNNFAGSLSNKINDAAGNAPLMINFLMIVFCYTFLAVVIAFFTLWKVHAAFALSLLCFAFFNILIALYSVSRLNSLVRIVAENGSRHTGNMVDVITNILNVKLFNNYKHEIKRRDQLGGAYISSSQKRRWFIVKSNAFEGSLFCIYNFASLYFLVTLHAAGKVTVGDFAMILTLNFWIWESLWQLRQQFTTFGEQYGTVEQALETLRCGEAEAASASDKKLEVTAGKIEFREVGFSHPGAAKIFTNKSIVIEPKQKIGLAGHSGAGKSTFVNLILRQFELDAGQILIDDQDIANVGLGLLRDSVSFIPQDPTLFHRTIYENIAYGKVSAKKSAVVAAAKKARAHDFISNLRGGYDSLVGERGIKLSGGERQRIAIARAFLKNAPILILDEATSQLDLITEAEIQESLAELIRDKTTIVIAHRLSTLLSMDRILVFEKGAIVEDGSHEELLRLDGVYKKLWETGLR